MYHGLSFGLFASIPVVDYFLDAYTILLRAIVGFDAAFPPRWNRVWIDVPSTLGPKNLIDTTPIDPIPTIVA